MKTQQQNRNVPIRRSSIEPISALRPLRNFQQGVDRLFENFFSPDLTSWGNLPNLNLGADSELTFAPPTEMTESDKEYLLRMDVPGISKKDIHVELKDNCLIVSGERMDDREEKSNGRRFTECSYGSFYRSIPLSSNVNADQIHADCCDGVLEIAIPKTEASRAKAIPVGDKLQRMDKSQKTVQ